MNRFNFLPKWYENKKLKRLRILVTYINIFVFTLNLVGIFFLWREHSRYNGILADNKAILNTIEQDKNVKAEYRASKNIKVTMIYEELNRFLKDRIIRSADISESNVKVSIFHTSYDNYLNLIKELENSSAFRIIDLQPPMKKGLGIESIITLKYIE